MNLSYLDSILVKLINLRSMPRGTRSGITEDEIISLCTTTRKILLAQPTLLRLKAPVNVCGDLHGDFYDLLRIFEIGKYPPFSNYLFLGDYVDRGKQAIDIVALLFALKIKFPKNFFLLRGNHENWKLNRAYGFLDECVANYSDKTWKMINEVFRCLPLAAIIEDEIFCVHGGISPSLDSLDDIYKIKRPIDLSNSGLIADLLWSDPNPNVENGDWAPSDRGIGCLFGPQASSRFCMKFGFSLILRAHEVAPIGYMFPFPDDKSIVTIYSSSATPDVKSGAFLRIDEDLNCEFSIFSAMEEEKSPNAQNLENTSA